MNKGTFAVIAVLALTFSAASGWAQSFDPDLAWPLCGRITEQPPPGWQADDGCPSDRFGNPDHTDAPFSSTFGPRPLGSESNRFDFHRGVDLATPIGTPIFAVSDGNVELAGVDPGYSDPLIKLRHFRPGATSCSGGDGCWHSYYLHISGWLVSEDEWVEKGQLIGYTGASGASGFEHLHFEVRDAPAFDVFSAWSRDAVHPFGLLPYQVPNDSQVVFADVDASDPGAVRAELTVVSNRYDLVSVELSVFDAQGQEVPQAGAEPDANGYHVLPPFYDMNAWNFEFTHKDSSAFPWSSFGNGGANECPWADDHPASYSAQVHLDDADPGDFHVGLFNGVRVTTSHYWLQGDRDYSLGLEFLTLNGPAACLEATAVFASGDTATGQWGNCDGEPPPPPPPPLIELTVSTNKKGNQARLDWSGADGNRVDIRRDGTLVQTTRNDGSWNDRDVLAGGSYAYQVCETGGGTCSEVVSITL